MFVPPRYIYLEFSAPGKNDSSITFFVGNLPLGKPDGIIVAGIETARREIGESSRSDNAMMLVLFFLKKILCDLEEKTIIVVLCFRTTLCEIS